MPPAYRIAIYYAPLPEDELTELATAWLGRDPATNKPARHPDLPRIDDITAEPRRYGFHATLKPPMRLAPGHSLRELVDAASEMAAKIPAFDLPALAVYDIWGFLALRETASCPALQALADVCVEQLDSFRAPPSEAELARRRASGLTPAQDAMLRRWGYPHVFETWFFHMTLTRRLTAHEKAIFLPAAEAYFAPGLKITRKVSDLCVFTQPAPEAPFSICERLRLRG